MNIGTVCMNVLSNSNLNQFGHLANTSGSKY